MVNCNPETVSTDYDTSESALPGAADGRGRRRRRLDGDEPGRASGGHRPVGRSDPAEARPRARAGRHSDHRHLDRCDRPGRGPRAVPGAPRRPRAAPTPERDLPHGCGSEGGGGAHRLPRRGSSELRAGRTGDGDRLRRRYPGALRGAVRGGFRRGSHPDRPLPAGTPSRSTSMRCRTDAMSSSPGSWSTSRKPGSTPEIPPARSRPAPSRPESSRRSAARRGCSPVRFEWSDS